MRLILTLILALPLAAQLPIELMRKPSLSRSALAAGVQTGSANLLRYSEDISGATYTATLATKNSATTATFTGQYGRITQGINTVAGTTYTLSFKARAISGNTALVFWHTDSATGLATSLTVTSTLTRYSTTVLAKTGGGTVAFGIGDANASGFGQIEVTEFQVNEGSTALPYVATTDLQSIASIPPGTATLVRGANTGASTDDPTVSLAGWTFDSGDRISGLPAKGTAWTTTNCSGVECYTLTSAGTEYVNGEARRNKFRHAENITIATNGGSTWNTYATPSATVTTSAEVAPDGTATAFLLTPDAANSILGQSVTVAANTDYACSWWLRSTTGGNVAANLALFTTGFGAELKAENLTVTTSWAQYTVTANSAANTTMICAIGTGATWASGETMLGWHPQLNLGSTALPYQKTTDSREWALETVGNYVGLLTWWGRKDRVIGPGEVLNDYRGYIRPIVNARGNALP